jgi:AcrR family transcriptional regulator
MKTTSSLADQAPVGPDGPPGERILAAAASLFRRQGYEATSVRELASAVGIQSASLYYHISSKEELLHALCVDSLRNIRAAVELAIAGESDPEAQLRSLIHAHVTTAMADEDKHASMLLEMRSLSRPRHAEVVAMRDGYEEIVRGVLRSGQVAGAIRDDIDPKILGLSLLNLLNWSIFWYRPDGPLSPEQLSDHFAEIFVAGVMRRDHAERLA